MYDDAAQQIGPGEATAYGHAEIAAFWRSIFGELAVQQFSIEHLALQRSSSRADRIALRFRAKVHHLTSSTGTTTGVSRYGKESNREVELLGIVHAEFYGGRIIREWVLLDEVAIWMQILSA